MPMMTELHELFWRAYKGRGRGEAAPVSRDEAHCALG
jgi:hypothetical protein